MEVDSLNKVRMTTGSMGTANANNNSNSSNTDTTKQSNDVSKADASKNKNKNVAKSIEKIVSEKNTEKTNGKTKAEENFESREGFSKQYFDRVVEEANKKIAGTRKQFSYNYHEPTNRVQIRVIDTDTDEVIKEIPPEKELDAVAKMWELAGILIDEKI